MLQTSVCEILKTLQGIGEFPGIFFHWFQFQVHPPNRFFIPWAGLKGATLLLNKKAPEYTRKYTGRSGFLWQKLAVL